PEGEQTTTFDLALGLNREHLMHTAQGMVTPVALVPAVKGPPHVGAAGWLVHPDAPNLLLRSMPPHPGGAAALTGRFLEVAKHSGPAEFRCVRNPKSAGLVDARGNPLFDAAIHEDAVSFETSACDVVQLKVRFTE